MLNQVNRRQALKSVAATTSLMVIGRASGAADYGDLATNKFLGRVNVLATVEDSKVFTEGPAWGHGALYFTNVRAAKILKWDGQKLSIFRENSNEANGLHFDVKGDLWACEGSALTTCSPPTEVDGPNILAQGFSR